MSGTALILLLARHQLGVDVLSSVAELPAQMIDYLKAPDAWVWVYLIFAISNAMLPSQSDRRPWRAVALYMLAVALLFYFVVGVREIPEALIGLGLASIQQVSWALGLTVAVDLIVMLFLLVIEALIWALLGRRLDWS